MSTLLGLILTLLANGALLYCGHAAARRFWPSAGCRELASGPAVRLAANGVVSLVLVLLVFYSLATVGLLNAWVATAAAVGLAVVFHVAWGRGRDLWEGPRAFAGWARAVAGSRGALFLVGGGILLLFAAYRAALFPPLSFDSLAHSDYFAGSWVQAGRLVSLALPPSIEGYAFFPMHFEALVAWTMLPFHSDFLVNLVNFPVLALAAVALYALARELDLGVLDSSLAAALVAVSPALLAYVCTQYNDVLVTASLACSALFMVRYVRGRAWADAVLVFLASGVAVGTKYTAVPPAALVCLIGVVAALREKAGRWRRGLVALALALAVPACVGGFKYAWNWAAVGNPVYPANLRVLGRDLFPSPPAGAEVRDDLRQVAIAASYAATSQQVPLTWGPKLPAIAGLALLALALARRSRSPGTLWLVAAAWAVPVLYFYLDPSTTTVAARRFWPDASARFLGFSVALMTVSALAAVSLLASPWKRRIVRAGLCGFLLYDMFAMRVIPDSGDVVLALGLVLAALLALVVVLPRLAPSGRVVAAVAVAALLVGASGVQKLRDAKRDRFYATRTELHPIPKCYAAGWAFCDDSKASKAIALVSYERTVGHDWFFYPLMGRRLQNRVLYVSADGRGGPDFGVWSEGLRRAAVTHLFVQLNPTLPPGDPRGRPVEMAWVEARPDAFSLLDSGVYYRVYRLR